MSDATEERCLATSGVACTTAERRPAQSGEATCSPGCMLGRQSMKAFALPKLSPAAYPISSRRETIRAETREKFPDGKSCQCEATAPTQSAPAGFRSREENCQKHCKTPKSTLYPNFCRRCARSASARRHRCYRILEWRLCQSTLKPAKKYKS